MNEHLRKFGLKGRVDMQDYGAFKSRSKFQLWLIKNRKSKPA
jgi:hypothetical protein